MAAHLKLFTYFLNFVWKFVDSCLHAGKAETLGVEQATKLSTVEQGLVVLVRNETLVSHLSHADWVFA